MYEIIASGGLVGSVIFFLSLSAVALVVKYCLDLRREKIAPSDLAMQLGTLLSEGKISAAEDLCRENPCPLSFVTALGLQDNDGDWSEIEKTLEDAVGEQSSKLFRKVEYLAVIGNIAPMLGLLGTVLGMITAFQQIAISQGGAQGPELARGIYQALVTTVEGLVVAIPSIAAFAFFRSRVDQLMMELSYTTLQIFLPLKRHRRRMALQAKMRETGVRTPPPVSSLGENGR